MADWTIWVSSGFSSNFLDPKLPNMEVLPGLPRCSSACIVEGLAIERGTLAPPWFVKWRFSYSGGTIFGGGPTKSIVVFWDLYWALPICGNCHISPCPLGMLAGASGIGISKFRI